MAVRAYLVRSGDTLRDVATYLRTSAEYLRALNSYRELGEDLQPGDLIALPPGPHGKKLSLHAYLAQVNSERFGSLASDPPWLQTALREEGQRELAVGENPRIIEYLHSVSTLEAPARDHDETAWCACFAQWCFAQAGIAGQDSAWALDWKTWAHTSRIERGALAVFERHEDGRLVGGYVGFVLSDNGASVELLGGNQGNAVSRSNYPKDGPKGENVYRILGCRAPS